MSEQPLWPINRDHLGWLTGELGIWQHARATTPNTEFGYCTDDVARALGVDLLHGRELGWPAVQESARRSLRFLEEAFDANAVRFRNFRAADGSWAVEPASEDSQGRALLALAAGIGAGDPPFVHDARTAFAAALPVARRLRALRATSSALVACDVALDTHALGPVLRADTLATLERLAARLAKAFGAVDTRSDWPWPEPVLTYENALLPRALLVAGRRLDDDELRRTGRRVLAWLIEVQATADGTFSPIGSAGWWPHGGVKSQFDQQPIEATATILACEAALLEPAEAQPGADARAASPTPFDAALEAAYAWFLGRNDLGIAVAVVGTGGCHDGLTPVGVNLNQGAESTLMWLTALEHVRGVRRTRRETAIRARLPAPRPEIDAIPVSGL